VRSPKGCADAWSFENGPVSASAAVFLGCAIRLFSLGSNEGDTTMMTTLQHESDRAIIRTLHQLCKNERAATAELLVYLAEVDRRKLYADQGYSSMFAFCQDALHMAGPSIYVRIGAARCSRRFPRVLDMLRRGELHLSAITLLAPRLTDENCDILLAEACHKTKRQVEELVADMAPKRDVKSGVRKLPAATPKTDATAEAPTTANGEPMTPPPAAAPISSAPPATSVPSAASVPPATSVPSAASVPSATQAPLPSPTPLAPPKTHHLSPSRHPEPLGAGRFKVQFTAEERLHAKIRQAQDLMRHKCPSGDLAQVFEAALDQFILAENKRQHAATDRPRPAKAPASTDTPSRHIPNQVKRAVYARDEGQCAFVAEDGRRCTERGGLQYHHEVPFAKGGASTEDNVRLLCASHNALHARRDYGADRIAARVQAATDARARSPKTRSNSSRVEKRRARDTAQLSLCSEGPPGGS